MPIIVELTSLLAVINKVFIRTPLAGSLVVAVVILLSVQRRVSLDRKYTRYRFDSLAKSVGLARKLEKKNNFLIQWPEEKKSVFATTWEVRIRRVRDRGS